MHKLYMRSKLNPKKINEVKEDFIYKSTWVSKLINNVMEGGKRKKAEDIVYKALKKLCEKTGKEFVDLIEIIKKQIHLERRTYNLKIGGSSLKVPKPISVKKSENLGIKKIVFALKNRKNEKFFVKENKLTTAEDKLFFLLEEIFQKKETGKVIELINIQKNLNKEGEAFANY